MEQRNRDTETQKHETNILRFQSFPVYQELRLLRKRLKELSKERFPKEESYVLRQQMWRALDSTLLNIAEGADRHSDVDFSRFLNQSLGSVNEVVACLDCALDDGYVSHLEHKEFMFLFDNTIRQLKAFLAKVRRDNRRF